LVSGWVAMRLRTMVHRALLACRSDPATQPPGSGRRRRAPTPNSENGPRYAGASRTPPLLARPRPEANGYLRCGTNTSVIAVVFVADRSSAVTEDTRHCRHATTDITAIVGTTSVASSAPSAAFYDRSAFVEVAEEDGSHHRTAFDAGFSGVSVPAADVDLLTDLSDDGIAVEDGGGGGVDVDPVGVALKQQWHLAGGVWCFDPQAAGDGVGTEDAYSSRLHAAVSGNGSHSGTVNRRLISADVEAATPRQHQRYEQQHQAGPQLHGDQTPEQPGKFRWISRQPLYSQLPAVHRDNAAWMSSGPSP